MTLESINASFEDPHLNGRLFAKGEPPPNGLGGGGDKGEPPPNGVGGVEDEGEPPPNGKSGDPPPNGKSE